MSMFYNNYQKICQENDDALSSLSAKSFSALQRMFEYIRSYNISLFELEIIKKDMIGIAKEADLENTPFLSKLGTSEKEFCRSILRDDTTQHTMAEHIVPLIRTILLYLLLFHSLTFFFGGVPADFGITVFDILFSVFCVVSHRFFDIRIWGRTVYVDESRRKTARLISGAIYLTLTVLILCLPDIFIIRGNGWIIMLILVLLALAAFFGNNYFWNRLSRNYNWE